MRLGRERDLGAWRMERDRRTRPGSERERGCARGCVRLDVRKLPWWHMVALCCCWTACARGGRNDPRNPALSRHPSHLTSSHNSPILSHSLRRPSTALSRPSTTSRSGTLTARRPARPRAPTRTSSSAPPLTSGIPSAAVTTSSSSARPVSAERSSGRDEKTLTRLLRTRARRQQRWHAQQVQPPLLVHEDDGGCVQVGPLGAFARASSLVGGLTR
jgi:hypothetical protein